ncbi:hypothetical protein AB8884_03685 [Yersinia enterocolitica]|uniref:hypothetical protein n=1 Tax=Yersinia TaxID=629 RepID=UPI00286508A6|nr:hypothetical protein [Yersinia enterocolitica]HDL7632121.1 hypothetical protein [Yersinia enterocolitica]HDL7919183.1 hypothetical protein [Yersinia enterocolitica]HDV5951046.1 hypothetical protein [Yersinia enterocolitica]HDV7149609.1 hypothetical protein [Yersinia enterocolitica]
MKNMKRKFSMTEQPAPSWLEIMNQKIGVSMPDMSSVSKENARRVSALNNVSTLILSKLIKSESFEAADLYNSYGGLASKLDQCRDHPCGSMACAQCAAAAQLFFMAHHFSKHCYSEHHIVVTLDFNSESLSNTLLRDRPYLLAKLLVEHGQKLARHLKLKGVVGEIVGSWTMEYRTFAQRPSANHWAPQLRLLVPDDKKILGILQMYMQRKGHHHINEMLISTPMRTAVSEDQTAASNSVFYPNWSEVPCFVDSNLQLIKGVPCPLNQGSLPKALLALDIFDRETWMFEYIQPVMNYYLNY